MQLVDELSMIYTTCLMCYASFSYSRSSPVKIFLAVALAGLAVFITLYYHYLQDPVFHQNAYALLTTVVVLRSMYTMEVALRPKWRKSREEDRLARERQGLPVPSKERQEYENARDLKILNTMWFMVVYGLSMFLVVSESGTWIISSAAHCGAGDSRLVYRGVFCLRAMVGGESNFIFAGFYPYTNSFCVGI